MGKNDSIQQTELGFRPARIEESETTIMHLYLNQRDLVNQNCGIYRLAIEPEQYQLNAGCPSAVSTLFRRIIPGRWPACRKSLADWSARQFFISVFDLMALDNIFQFGEIKCLD